MADDLARLLAKKIENDMLAAIMGSPLRQRQTALRVRGRTFDTVELDDAGNIIEPCRKCGPFLLCSEHMALVT